MPKQRVGVPGCMPPSDRPAKRRINVKYFHQETNIRFRGKMWVSTWMKRRRRLAIPPLSARYCLPDSHRGGIHPGTPTRCFGIPGYRPLAYARCGVFQTLFLIFCRRHFVDSFCLSRAFRIVCGSEILSLTGQGFPKHKAAEGIHSVNTIKKKTVKVF